MVNLEELSKKLSEASDSFTVKCIIAETLIAIAERLPKERGV